MTGEVGPTADSNETTGPGDATGGADAPTGEVGAGDDDPLASRVGPSPDIGPADAVRAQLDALAAADVEIPYPKRDVTVSAAADGSDFDVARRTASAPSPAAEEATVTSCDDERAG